METITYSVDKDLPRYILKLVRCIIQTILRWADMLNLNCSLKVGAPYVVWFQVHFSDTTF